MYEEHFGLEKRPFSGKAVGADVFVGPQTAKTMEGFRKALAVQDAVVTVSGPVGTGKTTLVERALNAIGSKYKTIRVGRMKMDSSDVLEALLIVLGVTERPSGTIQRFGALRRKLQQLQEAETRVFVLVEDAVHAGAEMLAELEALTDAEGGESDGASIVLMGDERLFDFMRDPELARLQQRVRRRHRIQPLCIPEMLGYLRHGFRTAGADFERIFDARSAELFHRLSDGIPRVANNLVDAVLVAAAKAGMEKIPAAFIAEIVADEFGLTTEGFDLSIPGPVADTSAEPAREVAAGPVAEPGEQPLVDTAPKLEASQESPPAVASADQTESPREDSTDIPHLIDDTQPDLSILSKRYAALSEDEFEATPEIAAGTDDVNVDAESEARAAHQDVEEISADADTIVAEDADTLADVVPELKPEPEPEPLGEVIAEPSLEVSPGFEAGSEPLTDEVPVLEPVQESVSDVASGPEAAPPSSLELVAEFTAEFEPQPVAEAEGDAGDIPELTPASGPGPENAADSDAETDQRPVLEIVPDSPELDTAVDINGPESQDDTPEWDREPTFAQLMPDLDALEHAIADNHVEALDPKPQTPPEPESPAVSIEEEDDLPEITLDKSIETGIQNQLLEEPAAIQVHQEGEGEELPDITLDKSIATGIQEQLLQEPVGIQAPQAAKKSDVELGQIAANIANAKTLDDIDDIMAETLFGTSISMIAAAVTANPPSDESANDEVRDLGEAAPATEQQAVQASPLPQQIREEISIETPEPAASIGLDPSASQRLKTVRALSADLHPSLREPAKSTPAATAPPVNEEPQPIEDQINTSITQTLQALKIPPEMEDEEPEEEQKSGFFSRFRRSK